MHKILRPIAKGRDIIGIPVRLSELECGDFVIDRDGVPLPDGIYARDEYDACLQRFGAIVRFGKNPEVFRKIE